MGAARALKRIPLIKFPQRRPNSSGTIRQAEESVKDDVFTNDDLVRKFFSRPPPNMSVGGKATDQPRRTPVTEEEIEAIMLGGCT